jgi:diaminopimelate epimerase
VNFEKYEGLGNDFVVVETASEDEVLPARAAAICERRHGVGADGVLLVLPPRTPGADARMHVLNADGSVSEMCGNGVRCVALHVARSRRVAKDAPSVGMSTLRIDTGAGTCECRVEDANAEAMVTVDMGVVRVLGERTLDVEGRRLTVRQAEVGNPHAVMFGAFARADVDALGPRIATHRDFPRGTNVEFARVAPDGIDLVVWERGVGVTLACGTGACATAAVAVAEGLVSPAVPVAVHLPGGRLDITLEALEAPETRQRAAGERLLRVKMRGPARHVFSGAV